MFSCLFYGALSDAIGRRKIMIFACLAAFIDSVIVLLVMTLKLPIPLIFIGAFFNGLGGAFTGLAMVSFAYLADVYDKEKLPVRMGKSLYVC